MNIKRILFFGSYNPGYSRNRVILKCLNSLNFEVIECRDNSVGFSKFFKLFNEYWNHKNDYDLMFVPFPGQEIMPIAWALNKIFGGRPIIFDAFTSHYGGYILDRKYYAINSPRAIYYRFIDKLSCYLADRVILDTQAHVNFFVEEFKIPKDKFNVVLVSTDTDIFKPAVSSITNDTFLVHFHGNFIPLQGSEYIIGAARLLESENIKFNIVGRGQDYKKARESADRHCLKNIEWVDPVSYESLPNLISKADLCLGIFGNSPKTELVIPNKIYEYISMAKTVITADTEAVREVFKDRENIILCRKADSEDLASSIIRLRDDSRLRREVALKSYELFKKDLSPEVVTRQLAEIINNL